MLKTFEKVIKNRRIKSKVASANSVPSLGLSRSISAISVESNNTPSAVSKNSPRPVDCEIKAEKESEKNEPAFVDIREIGEAGDF